MAGMFDFLAPQQQQAPGAINPAAQQLAAMTPQQRIAYSRIAGAQQMAQGTGQLAAGMLGAPVQDPALKMRMVQAEVAEAMKGKDASDPMVAYPILIGILNKHGMTREALMAGQEFESVKDKRENRSIQRGQLERAERKDAAMAAYNEAKLSDPKSPQGKVMFDIQKLQEKLAALPEGDPGRVPLENQIKMLEAAFNRQMAAQGMKIVALGDRTEIWAGMPPQLMETRMAGISPTAAANIEESKRKSGELDAGAIKRIEDGMSVAQNYVATAGRFNPAYLDQGIVSQFASATGLEAFLQKAKSLTATTPSEQAAAAWWSELASLINVMRNQLFGSALTATENAAFDAVRPLQGQSAEVVAERLNNSLREMKRGLKSRMDVQAAAGKDVTNVMRLIDSLPDQAAQAAGGVPKPAPRPTAAPAGAPQRALPPGVTVERIS